jgi:hypothetical protein
MRSGTGSVVVAAVVDPWMAFLCNLYSLTSSCCNIVPAGRAGAVVVFMAGQGWSFDALDHGADYRQNGLDDANNYDHNYDGVQGATWADLEDAHELGEHW